MRKRSLSPATLTPKPHCEDHRLLSARLSRGGRLALALITNARCRCNNLFYRKHETSPKSSSAKTRPKEPPEKTAKFLGLRRERRASQERVYLRGTYMLDREAPIPGVP